MKARISFFVPLITVMLLAQGAAHAECVMMDPVCRDMHDMSDALHCLSTPNMDDTDRTISNCASDSAGDMESLTDGLKDARTNLVARFAQKPDDVKRVNAFFDRVEAAVATLEKAMHANDEANKQAAFTVIKQTMKEAHSLYNPATGPSHP